MCLWIRNPCLTNADLCGQCGLIISPTSCTSNEERHRQAYFSNIYILQDLLFSKLLKETKCGLVLSFHKLRRGISKAPMIYTTGKQFI